MASDDPIDGLTKQAAKIAINENENKNKNKNENENENENEDENEDENAQAVDHKVPPVILYGERKASINFVRLTKGCQLFSYVYETTKSKLRLEQALWNRRVCIALIQGKECQLHKKHKCKFEHQPTYRQTNLCTDWYSNKPCPNDEPNCQNIHHFEEVTKYHQFILTEDDAKAYRFIQFIRHFTAHFRISVIRDNQNRQDLYRRVIALMVHLVHVLSPKKPNSIEHLNLFLGIQTIKQLIPEKELLIQLEKSYDVPEDFFMHRVEFDTDWYQPSTRKQSVNFNQLSSEFIAYFKIILKKYFEVELKPRGAKSGW